MAGLISYAFACFVGFATTGIAWSASRQSNSRHGRLFELTFVLAVVIELASIFYFLRYVILAVAPGQPLPVYFRIICRSLRFAIFFFFTCFAMEAITGQEPNDLKRKKYIIYLAGFVSILTIVGYIVASFFFVNGSDYVEVVGIRVMHLIVTAIDCLITWALLIYFCVRAANTQLSSTTRIFIYVVSISLSVNLFFRYIPDNARLGVDFGHLTVLHDIDPGSAASIIMHLATMIFVIHTDFSPLYKPRFSKATGEQAENGISEPSNVFADVAVENRLTEREKEVMELLYTGLTYGVIADQMGISINTVKRHAHNCYEKLGITSRYELTFIINSHNNTSG